MSLFNKILNSNGNHKVSLGLHFGHDGSITMLNQDEIYYKSTERNKKIKHAIGIDTDEIIKLINTHNIKRIFITSTQGLPVFYDSSKLKISIDQSIDYSAQKYFNSLPKRAEWKNFFYNEILNYSGRFIYEESFSIDKKYKEEIFNDYESLSNQKINLNKENLNTVIFHEGSIELKKKKN